MNRLLWVVQILLALLFRFAGGSKLFMSAAGLSIFMIGAMVTTIQTMGQAMAAMPLLTGALTIFVAYGPAHCDALCRQQAIEVQNLLACCSSNVTEAYPPSQSTTASLC